jgi:hypothetical protein
LSEGVVAKNDVGRQGQAFRQQRKTAANIPRSFIGFAQAGMGLRLDFVTWFMPRSIENDQLTKRISKLHVVRELENRSIVRRENKTANATTFNGQDLSQGREIVLDRRGILSLAGSYSLDVMPFLLNPAEAPAISNIRHWTRPGMAASPRMGRRILINPFGSSGEHASGNLI